jgi:hypothetical protein
MEIQMNKLCLILATIVLFSSGEIFAAKKKKKIKTTKTFTPKQIKDRNYHVKFGYQRDDYQDINLQNTDSGTEALKTSGVFITVGIEYKLTDFLSTTSKPGFSYGAQSRKATGDFGDNEVKTYTFKFAQSLNLNYQNDYFIFQPFIEAAIGYGWFHHKASWKNVSTNYAYSSNLEQESIIFEIGAGMNFKFPNGLIPFTKVGLRKFTMEDEDDSVARSDPAAQSEAAIDTKKNYSSVFFIVGLGFEFQ